MQQPASSFHQHTGILEWDRFCWQRADHGVDRCAQAPPASIASAGCYSFFAALLCSEDLCICATKLQSCLWVDVTCNSEAGGTHRIFVLNPLPHPWSSVKIDPPISMNTHICNWIIKWSGTEPPISWKGSSSKCMSHGNSPNIHWQLTKQKEAHTCISLSFIFDEKNNVKKWATISSHRCFQLSSLHQAISAPNSSLKEPVSLPPKVSTRCQWGQYTDQLRFQTEHLEALLWMVVHSILGWICDICVP